jgi:hypothetical protein
MATPLTLNLPPSPMGPGLMHDEQESGTVRDADLWSSFSRMYGSAYLPER